MKRPSTYPRTLPVTGLVPAPADPPDDEESAADRTGSGRLTRKQLDPLVHAAISGEPGAVSKLLALISPAVARYCRARIGGRDLAYVSADDVAQEACLAVLKALPSYQDRGGSFLYLVHAIASNKVADAFRAVSRDRSDPMPELPEPDLGENTPERNALDRDLRARLATLLGHLPAVQQEILVLRIAVGLTANETAEAVGLTPGNVRTAQHRALTRLRAMVSTGDAW